MKKTCDTCRCNKVCDHNKYGFENCDNYIPTVDFLGQTEDGLLKTLNGCMADKMNDCADCFLFQKANCMSNLHKLAYECICQYREVNKFLLEKIDNPTTHSFGNGITQQELLDFVKKHNIPPKKIGELFFK